MKVDATRRGGEAPRLRWWFWIVPGVCLAVLLGTGGWLSSRHHRSRGTAASTPVIERGALTSTSDSARRAAELASDPVAYVAARRGNEDPAVINELVEAYREWTARGEALDGRREIVRALLAHSNVRVGVEALLAAVALDQTPREQDPMWRELVRDLGASWNHATFPLGRDLAQIEERAKPKDLLLESLLQISPDKLADAQKPLLVSDFIDMYYGMKPDQKIAAERAMATLGSTDVPQILAGHGLEEGNGQLRVVAERHAEVRAVAREAMRQTAKVPEPTPEAEP